jgi:hypothetical protein
MRLDGKKTYITAIVMALASFAVGMDWLTQTQYQVILGLLGSMGLATLRSGLCEKKTAKKIKNQPAPAPFPGVDAGGPGLGR